MIGFKHTIVNQMAFEREAEGFLSYYPHPIKEYFLRPHNVGEVEAASAVGDTGSLVCGAALRLTMRIEAGTQQITDAGFRAAGCGYLIAAASLLTEMLKDIKLAEALALPSMLESVMAEHLGEFPADRLHCLTLCRDALSMAINDYRANTQGEWAGEEALICTCFGVSEKTIEAVIRLAAPATVEEITAACNAGGGCGSCRPLIEDILGDLRRTGQSFPAR